MSLAITRATPRDAIAVTTVRNAAAVELTARHGTGHWSSLTSREAVLRHMATSHVLIARDTRRAVGTLRLAAKKPWAIDVKYFTPAARPVYLVDMAVLPDHQRAGVGRQLLEHAAADARREQFEVIRLDAYDTEAGAGGFYARCGYREVGRVVYRKVPLVYFELVL